jgi:alpha-1,6-mannosyltransferase
MKLCVVTQSYARTGGGGRTVMAAERAWYAGHGIDYVMIVPGPKDTKETVDGCTVYNVASPMVPGSTMYRLLLRSGRVAQLLREERPDIVETHCIYNLPWTALRYRAKYGGIVSAFYMTDVPEAYIGAPIRKRLGKTAGSAAKWLAQRYVKSLYNRCDAVIAISKVMQQRLIDIGVREPHHVSLGVDLETYNPRHRSQALRHALGVGPDDLMLVYAGRFDREREPDVLIDAVAQLPRDFPVRLILAGVGPLRAQLEQHAAQVGRVGLLGFMQRSELATLLASSDVYVSAMAHETFGLSVAEAQASGLPVVGVRAGAMIERVRDARDDPSGDGFLVPVSDSRALAARLLETPREAWAEMGARARQRVAAELSWDRTFESVMGIYRRALEKAAYRLPRQSHLSSV